MVPEAYGVRPLDKLNQLDDLKSSARWVPLRIRRRHKPVQFAGLGRNIDAGMNLRLRF